MNKISQLLRLGNALLSGPGSVYPADKNRALYLESSISIQWRSEDLRNFRSMRIYCDASGDDEEGYLEPMVRFASWNRSEDIHALKPR